VSRQRPLAYLALLGQTAISGGTYLVGRYAIGQLGWSAAVMLRNLGSALLFVGLLAWRGARPLPPRPLLGRALLLGLLVVPANQALFFAGLGRTSPTHAALLFALTPMFVMLLGLASRAETLVPARVAGVLLALVGAAVVVLERPAGVIRSSLEGDLLVLGAVVAWALYTVLGRPFVQRHGPVRSTGWSLVGGTLLFLPFGLPSLAQVPAERFSPTLLSAMAFIVLMTGFLAYLCWYYALARVEASHAAIFTNLQPLVAALLAWGVYGEPVTPRLALGGAVIVCGVLLATGLVGRAVRSMTRASSEEPG